MTALLSIGQVASRTGLTPDALRYYERERLLPAVPRDGAGRRQYPPQVLHALEVVQTLRSAGFAVEEVRAVLAAKRDGEPMGRRVQRVRAELERLTDRLAEKRRVLNRADRVLEEMLAELDEIAGRPTGGRTP